jgi:hypothetical protein
MFLIGVAYLWAYLKWGTRGEGDGPARRAFYLVMLLAMLQAEGDLAANLAGIVKTAIMMLVTIQAMVWFGGFRDAGDSPRRG